MSKKVTFSIMILAILCNCKEKREEVDKIEVQQKSNITENCLSKNEKEKMLEKILKTYDFQLFLDPEVDGRLPVRLQKNDFVTEDLELESNGFPVVFEDSLDLPYGNIHRLRIIDRDCENQKFGYSIFYPIEGAIMTGTVSKSDTTWLITDSNWGIKD
ncbi:hypothetical protein [Flagellimonas marina]|uniref:Lipoprotein n=1 Tax=Flagellimonas marina TaxID=1775168 RepID=A0ABV8PL98_9FLAO